MKFIRILLMINSLFGLCGSTLAQTSDQNLSKYWYYRYKLRHTYLKAGEVNYDCVDPDPNGIATGYSIPASGYTFDFKSPHWGDATIDLGWYIGTLATEYKLLKDQGQATGKTEEELYYAMKAYERLDLHAEKNGYPYNGSCELNGFFTRDDVSQEFYNKYFASKYPNGSPYFSDYEIRNKKAVENSPDLESEKNMYFPSQDQIIGLLMGFALVVKGVDASANYKGYNFKDNAKWYSDLMVSYVSNHEYTIPIPNTDPVEYAKYGKEAKEYAYGMAKAGQVIQKENWGGEFISSGKYENWVTAAMESSWQNLATGTGIRTMELGLDDYARGFLQTMAAIGHSWRVGLVPVLVSSVSVPHPYPCPTKKNPFKWCHDNITVELWCYEVPEGLVIPAPITCSPHRLPNIAFNTTDQNLSLMGARFKSQYFPLLHQYLHKGANPQTGKSFYKEAINTAPCKGPYYYANDPGVEGWRAEGNRWIRSDRAKDGETEGEFNGLDYMLLYNVYALVEGKGSDGIGTDYVNRLHREVTTNYPDGESGTNANPASIMAFEDIVYTGTVGPGGNLVLRAGDYVDISSADFQYGSNSIVEHKPFECSSDGTSYLRVAASQASKAPDTVAIRKQYEETVLAGMQKELESKMPEINQAMAQSKYVPIEQYLADVNREGSTNRVRVVPNPATNKITVETKVIKEGTVEVMIYDVYGKAVIGPMVTYGKRGTVKTEIDISSLSEGTYFYTVKTSDNVQKGKFIKGSN